MSDDPTGADVPEFIHVEKELRRCPACGYEDGFHVSFSVLKAPRAEVILICPRCSKRYRTGWAVTLA
ncbi:hypothetical protein [Desulfoluna spongiiphila]|uniref:hypothetical protein n=1 Tax=Desulfoluna spongiiphila TaxID=419481 RepID=UPI000B896567|nr:hypothetical protein [Desulfoluna spongiiphila]